MRAENQLETRNPKLETGLTKACMNPLPPPLFSKVTRLKRWLAELRYVAVAFSGGVDSSVLLHIARDRLGDNVVAVTARSEVLPRCDLEDAVRLAEHLSVQHWVLESKEMALGDFVRNGPDRCYVCKKARYSSMLEVLQGRGAPALLDGSNADDDKDYRPGNRAVKELGIRSPLREIGLSKAEVRELARYLGLDCWNKPASACLASRIPYGSCITREKLEQVEMAEEFIRGLRLARQVRVRHHGDTARIEVEGSALMRIMEQAIRRRIVEHLTGLGFHYVTLDLAGYSMGSLNRVIEQRDDFGQGSSGSVTQSDS